MHTTNHLGNIGEIAVMLEATKRGYQVSVPQGHCSRYDLIIDKSGKLFRAQVKTIKSDGQVAKIRTKSINVVSGVSIHKIYTAEEIDCIIIHDVTTNRFAWFPSSLLGQHEIRLRYIPTINNQNFGIRFFQDYENW